MSSDSETVHSGEIPATGRTLTTSRLTLRPFEPHDAEAIQELASDIAIAATTRGIEHPYPEGAALAWIETHMEFWNNGSAVILAICPTLDEADSGIPLAVADRPVGAIGLHVERSDHFAELGYWIGKPWWNRGLATEAARAVIDFGFEQLGLNRIVAHHMASNRASGQVLRKIGMTREGTLRQHVRKWGEFHDVHIFGLLARDRIPDLNANGGSPVS